MQAPGGMPVRKLLMTALAACFLAVGPGSAQDGRRLAYRIEIDQDQVQHSFREHDGKRPLFVPVVFKPERMGEAAESPEGAHIVVEEDGQEVARLKLEPPGVRKLTTVLALDVSGSMA